MYKMHKELSYENNYSYKTEDRIKSTKIKQNIRLNNDIMSSWFGGVFSHNHQNTCKGCSYFYWKIVNFPLP